MIVSEVMVKGQPWIRAQYISAPMSGGNGDGPLSPAAMKQIVSAISRLVDEKLEDRLAFLLPDDDDEITPDPPTAPSGESDGVQAQYRKKGSSSMSNTLPGGPRITPDVPARRAAAAPDELVSRKYGKHAITYADKQRERGIHVTYSESLDYVKKNYARDPQFGTGLDFGQAWRERSVSTGDGATIREFRPPAARPNQETNDRISGKPDTSWAGAAPNYVPGVSAYTYFSPEEQAIRQAAWETAEQNRRRGQWKPYDEIVADLRADRLRQQAITGKTAGAA